MGTFLLPKSITGGCINTFRWEALIDYSRRSHDAFRKYEPPYYTKVITSSCKAERTNSKSHASQEGYRTQETCLDSNNGCGRFGSTVS